MKTAFNEYNIIKVEKNKCKQTEKQPLGILNSILLTFNIQKETKIKQNTIIIL